MMKASDVMALHVITVGPELDVKAVANTLAANGISAVPVIDIKNNILGIISEGDLMRRIAPAAGRPHGHKAKDVMTRQVITVDPDASLQEIANVFEKHGIKRVPVVKNGELVGIVSRANLVQALAIHGLPFFERLEADEALRQAVLSKIQNLRGAGSMVDIIVNRGTVNLWGVVRTEEEKNAFQTAAEQTPGVRAVHNHMRVLLG